VNDRGGWGEKGEKRGGGGKGIASSCSRGDEEELTPVADFSTKGRELVRERKRENIPFTLTWNMKEKAAPLSLTLILYAGHGNRGRGLGEEDRKRRGVTFFNFISFLIEEKKGGLVQKRDEKQEVEI